MDANDRRARLNLLLSSNEQVDIWQDAWEPLQAQNRIANITEAVSKSPELIKVYGVSAWDAMKTTDGKIWGVPRNVELNHYPLWIRKDWLAKLNLKVPTTIEEYERVLEAFKREDPAGNGRTVPLLIDELPNSLLAGFTEGGSGVYRAPDGKIYPYFMDPGYKDMLAKLADWYSGSYLHPENFIFNTNQKIDLIRQGRAGSFLGWYSRITLNWEIMRSVVPEAEFVNIPLQGPKGYITTANSYPRYSFGTSGGTNAYVINSKTKDLDAVIRLFEWGNGNVSNYMTARYGFEGEGWTWTDKEKGIFHLTGQFSATGLEYAHLFLGPVMERFIMSADSPTKRHHEYLYNFQFDKDSGDFSTTKYPLDRGVHFDATALLAAAPNQADMQRILEEDTIAFITGKKLLTDYSSFIAAINRIGMDALSAELTKQFNAWKK
jgi:hypothetical protein